VKTGHPSGKPRCPCCGHVALTPAEERVLVATRLNPVRGVTIKGMRRVASLSYRGIVRSIGSLRRLGLVELAAVQSHGEKLWRSTVAGRHACSMLAGRTATE